MILVDSSVWINYFNGVQSWQTDLLDDLLVNTPLIISDLILAEVLQGFRSEKDYKQAKSCLGELTFRPMVGYDIAIKSAQNYRMLRSRGITVRKTIDMLIATFCIVEDVTILHDDHDFEIIAVHLPLKVLAQQTV